jgi:hypothetical protein
MGLTFGGLGEGFVEGAPSKSKAPEFKDALLCGTVAFVVAGTLGCRSIKSNKFAPGGG